MGSDIHIPLAVSWAQLVQRSLPKPSVSGLNTIIGNFLVEGIEGLSPEVVKAIRQVSTWRYISQLVMIIHIGHVYYTNMIQTMYAYYTLHMILHR